MEDTHAARLLSRGLRTLRSLSIYPSHFPDFYRNYNMTDTTTTNTAVDANATDTATATATVEKVEDVVQKSSGMYRHSYKM